MKSFFYVLTAIAVMGLAVWAYRQNYETQAKLREVRDLRTEIADLREGQAILPQLSRMERAGCLAAAERTTLADTGYIQEPALAGSLHSPMSARLCLHSAKESTWLGRVLAVVAATTTGPVVTVAAASDRAGTGRDDTSCSWRESPKAASVLHRPNRRAS